MKALLFPVASLLLAGCSGFGERPPDVLKSEVLNIETLDFGLPIYIYSKVRMAQMQKPEFDQSLKAAGLSPESGEDVRTVSTSWILVYRSSDGLTYLVDHLNMGLWVRDVSSWRCLASNIRVDNTMSGMPRALPFRYIGNGHFAISETLPHKVSESSPQGFPQAMAATFLIDSENGDILERSEGFVYDHNPPVKLPQEWLVKYGLRSEQNPKPGDE